MKNRKRKKFQWSDDDSAPPCIVCGEPVLIGGTYGIGGPAVHETCYIERGNEIPHLIIVKESKTRLIQNANDDRGED